MVFLEATCSESLLFGTVYTGDMSNLRREAWLDSVTGELSVPFLAIQGIEYHFHLGGSLESPNGKVAFQLVPGKSNDAFESRTDLGATGNVDVLANLKGATAQNGEPFHADELPISSLWWSWTAPEAGVYEIDAQPASAIYAKPRLGVYKGTTVSALQPIISSTIRGGRLTIAAQPNETYAVVLDAARLTPPGEYRLTLEKQGNTLSFEDWISSFVEDPASEDASPGGDFDGDGVHNLAEFVFSESPETLRSMQGLIDITTADGQIVLRYDRAKGRDFRVGYEWSSNLAEWQRFDGGVDATASELVSPNGQNGETVEAVLDFHSSEKAFIRLTLSLP